MPSLRWNERSHKDKLARTHTLVHKGTNAHLQSLSFFIPFLLFSSFLMHTCRHNPSQNATREQKQYHLISSNSSINLPGRWRDTRAGMACVYSCDRSKLSSRLNIQYSAMLPLWTVQFHDAFDGSTSKLDIIIFNSNILIHFLCLGPRLLRRWKKLTSPHDAYSCSVHTVTTPKSLKPHRTPSPSDFGRLTYISQKWLRVLIWKYLPVPLW